MLCLDGLASAEFLQGSKMTEKFSKLEKYLKSLKAKYERTHEEQIA